jgi:hypothetical protein
VQTPGASPAPYDYQQGDRLKILGTALGGTTPDNDVDILITATGIGNDIDSFTFAGTSILGGATYNNVGQTSTTGVGVGFEINVTRTGGTGTYSISLVAAGTGYIVTEQVTFAGTSFGGASPANDIVLEIDSVTGTGDVLTFSTVGTPVGDSGDQTYSGTAADNVAHLGSGAEFNITRTTGTYSATINQTGTFYEEGNIITVLGTTLDGATTANDATIIVTGITGGGAIDTISISGVGYAGDSITVFPTMAISEPITGPIPAGTALDVGAIATFQVDFQAPHGLVPGTTILSQVTSQPAPTLASTARTFSVGSGSWSVVGLGGVFVAIRAGSTATQRSTNGQTWAAGGDLPSGASWISIAAGEVNGTN